MHSTGVGLSNVHTQHACHDWWLQPNTLNIGEVAAVLRQSSMSLKTMGIQLHCAEHFVQKVSTTEQHASRSWRSVELSWDAAESCQWFVLSGDTKETPAKLKEEHINLLGLGHKIWDAPALEGNTWGTSLWCEILRRFSSSSQPTSRQLMTVEQCFCGHFWC